MYMYTLTERENRMLKTNLCGVDDRYYHVQEFAAAQGLIWELEETYKYPNNREGITKSGYSVRDTIFNMSMDYAMMMLLQSTKPPLLSSSQGIIMLEWVPLYYIHRNTSHLCFLYIVYVMLCIWDYKIKLNATANELDRDKVCN